MSKDPAFLFYTQDFIMGTALMTNEQVGLYIKLLCIQHQHGGLIDVVSFDELVKDCLLIRSKFIFTKEGYYNERLMKEMEARAVKSSNLSANAKKSWLNRCKSKANAMPKQMPIEDEDEDIKRTTNTSIFKVPTIQDITNYCKERKNSINPEAFFNHYEAIGWMRGKNKIKCWKACVRTWESRNKETEVKSARKVNVLN